MTPDILRAIGIIGVALVICWLLAALWIRQGQKSIDEIQDIVDRKTKGR